MKLFLLAVLALSSCYPEIVPPLPPKLKVSIHTKKVSVNLSPYDLKEAQKDNQLFESNARFGKRFSWPQDVNMVLKYKPSETPTLDLDLKMSTYSFYLLKVFISSLMIS